MTITWMKAQDTSPSKMPYKLWTSDLLQAFPPSHNAETKSAFVSSKPIKNSFIGKEPKIDHVFWETTKFSPKRKEAKIVGFKYA